MPKARKSTERIIYNEKGKKRHKVTVTSKRMGREGAARLLTEKKEPMRRRGKENRRKDPTPQFSGIEEKGEMWRRRINPGKKNVPRYPTHEEKEKGKVFVG